jgi:hypothetical protein
MRRLRRRWRCDSISRSSLHKGLRFALARRCSRAFLRTSDLPDRAYRILGVIARETGHKLSFTNSLVRSSWVRRDFFDLSSARFFRGPIVANTEERPICNSFHVLRLASRLFFGRDYGVASRPDLLAIAQLNVSFGRIAWLLCLGTLSSETSAALTRQASLT